MARRGDQELHDALTILRDRELVPWAWLQDETRQSHSFSTAPSVLAYVKGAARNASLDRWDGKPAPQILCESRSLAGVLYSTAALYACPIASTNGQARGFLVNEIAPYLQADQRVLYLGDWDLCGNAIEEATRRTLVKHAAHWGTMYRATELVRGVRRRRRTSSIEPLWERVALTTAQVEELDARRAAEGLGSAVIRKRDDRFNDGNGGRGKFFDAVETEALGQGVIVGMLHDRLDELMPEPLEDVHERERVQQDAMADFLDTYE
jgi:hypothetical protein